METKIQIPGMPRPIEMHAHDPMRYVGDMLAWIHQAVASESELMHNVIEGKKKMAGKMTVRNTIERDWASPSCYFYRGGGYV